MRKKIWGCCDAATFVTTCVTVVAAWLLLGVTTACDGKRAYSIMGEVEGLADGTVVELVPMSHDNDSALAETTVTGGKFQLVGIAEEPICAQIRVKDSWGGPYVVLENKDYELKGKIANVTEHPNGKVYEWEITVTGSPLTDKLAEFDARHDSLDLLYKAYQEEHGKTFEKYRNLKDSERKAFQETEEWKAAVAAEKNFFDTVEKTIMGMVEENKQTFWGPLLLVKYLSFLGEDQGDYYKSLPEEVKNSFYGKKIKEEIWPVGAAGEKVTEFRLKADDGTEYDFAKLAEGKKYVLLDFWASWCGPCRKELPNVKKAYEAYKDKGFEVVSISIDKDEKAWRKALQEEGMAWPNFRDQGVADLFKVKSVPTVYLLDSEGKIVASNMECRGEALGEKLKELLK